MSACCVMPFPSLVKSSSKLLLAKATISRHHSSSLSVSHNNSYKHKQTNINKSNNNKQQSRQLSSVKTWPNLDSRSEDQANTLVPSNGSTSPFGASRPGESNSYNNSVITGKRSYLNQDNNGHVKLDKAVQWYSNQAAIEAAATKFVCRLAPDAILYGGKDSMKMAQYLHKELPVRIAHRIVDFRCLPFIVGCNSKISYVHDLYIRAFHILSSIGRIHDQQTQQSYSRMLRQLLDDHKDVVSLLAEGFRACRRYIENEDTIQDFIDRTLASRLGIRLLSEHYLAIDQQRDNHIGIINKSCHLKKLIEKWCTFSQQLCETNYGRYPTFKIQGHVDSCFPYFEIPLNYIIPELLKNAARATVEHANTNLEAPLPEITITIANNSRDFIIRVSDFGGGIAHDHLDMVTRYHFSTSNQRHHHGDHQRSSYQHHVTASANFGDHHNQDISDNNSGISNSFMFDSIMKDPIAGDMHGFGFGLPISRAYASYLGGKLQLISMQGVGTDAYLRLVHLKTKSNSFLI